MVFPIIVHRHDYAIIGKEIANATDQQSLFVPILQVHNGCVGAHLDCDSSFLLYTHTPVDIQNKWWMHVDGPFVPLCNLML